MKLSSITRQYVAKILGGNFDRIEYLPTDGTKGGILLGWQASCIDVFQPMLKVFSLSIEIKNGWPRVSSSQLSMDQQKMMSSQVFLMSYDHSS
jgi:hypothetical protein